MVFVCKFYSQPITVILLNLSVLKYENISIGSLKACTPQSSAISSFYPYTSRTLSRCIECSLTYYLHPGRDHFCAIKHHCPTWLFRFSLVPLPSLPPTQSPMFSLCPTQQFLLQLPLTLPRSPVRFNLNLLPRQVFMPEPSQLPCCDITPVNRLLVFRLWIH